MASSVKAVKYKGSADARTISDKEWAAIGVEDQKSLAWDGTNDFTVAGDDIVDGALDYLRKDGEFSLVMEKTGA